MATLVLTPSSGSIVQGGVFVPPTFTAQDDSDIDISSPIVTGPVPAVDVNVVGTQTLEYTLTVDNANVAREITAYYTLTVTEQPSFIDKFMNGSKDKFGRDVSGSVYEKLVQRPTTIAAVNAGLFDETALDPYELAAAKVNIENNQDDQNSGAIT